jgi:hypothetical protein
VSYSVFLKSGFEKRARVLSVTQVIRDKKFGPSTKVSGSKHPGNKRPTTYQDTSQARSRLSIVHATSTDKYRRDEGYDGPAL